jgi:hypothetical protein
MVAIGYNVKFLNWMSLHNSYNFVSLEVATEFCKKYERFGYTSEINTIWAQESVSPSVEISVA